jgi:hypothetical protein
MDYNDAQLHMKQERPSVKIAGVRAKSLTQHLKDIFSETYGYANPRGAYQVWCPPLPLDK